MAKKGKNRSLNTHFWNDTFIAELEPDQKLLFIYLLTSPLTNMLGVYEIHLRRICFDTRLDREYVEEGLRIFEDAGKAKYTNGHIILANFIKNQNYNKNMMKSAASEIPDLPDEVTKDPFFMKVWEWFQTLPNASEILAECNVSLKNPSETVSKGRDKPRNDLFESKWRTKGVPIPEPLRTDAFKDVMEQYWDHLMTTFKKRPSIPMVEGKFKRLLELKRQGHDPVDVVQQTINDGNKKFYKITDKEFESKKKTHNGQRQEVDLNAIDEETSKVFAGRRQANEL